MTAEDCWLAELAIENFSVSCEGRIPTRNSF